jgi:hypothetical protein
MGRIGLTDRPPLKFFITIQLAHFHSRDLSFPHLSETALLTLFQTYGFLCSFHCAL